MPIEIKYGRRFLLEMMPPESVCAEIGVSQGLFSQEILDVVAPKKLHLIDPWAAEPHVGYYDGVCDQFRPQVESGQIEIHRNKSQHTVDQFEDNYFDWIYVDGSHSYKSVKNDLDLYYPKVKMYGFIAGDDYTMAPKRKGLRDAVAEIADKYMMRLILIKNNQFILWKKGPGMPPEGPCRPPE
ncbi:MAG: class I SAM-dependent methyltransferase [Desulfobacteraceae bacterium]|mgnify:CR=1 FL=1|nr:MAG: class I SAM-dependent methyltransferase [Desulfobacteraceae bacterium]